MTRGPGTAGWPATTLAVPRAAHLDGTTRAGDLRSALWVVLPALAISALIVAGSSLGSSGLALAGASLALLAAIAVPEVGLAVLAATATLTSPPGIPSPGLGTLLVGALLFGCIYRLPIDRPTIRLSVAGLLLIGFATYVAAQQLPLMLAGYAGDHGHDVGYLFFQFMTGVGLVFVSSWILRGRSAIPVLAMALIGTVVATGVAILTFEAPVTGPPFAGLVATGEVGMRAAGPFQNPNYLGTFAAVAGVATVALWTTVRSPVGRFMLVTVCGLSVLALVQAQSRGAIVAAFAGIAVLAWLRSRPLALSIVGVGLVAAVLIYPAFVNWRLTNLRGGPSDDGYVAMTESDDARLRASLAGPAMFLSEPIFGVGFGEFVEKSVTVSGLETGINAHNWYISVLAEQGITGTLLWLGGTVALAVELARRRGTARMLGAGVFTTLVVGFLFLEGPTSFQLVAVPSLFLTAALVSDWTLHRTGPPGVGNVIRSGGS